MSTIREINKSIPKHLRPLIDSGQIAKVLRLEVIDSALLDSTKRLIKQSFDRAKAEDGNRYMEPAEEFYGKGSIDSSSHLIYLFPCVSDRDFYRLKAELEYTRRYALVQDGPWEITSL